jgi:hypothetical protein
MSMRQPACNSISAYVYTASKASRYSSLTGIDFANIFTIERLANAMRERSLISRTRSARLIRCGAAEVTWFACKQILLQLYVRSRKLTILNSERAEASESPGLLRLGDPITKGAIPKAIDSPVPGYGSSSDIESNSPMSQTSHAKTTDGQEVMIQIKITNDKRETTRAKSVR